MKARSTLLMLTVLCTALVCSAAWARAQEGPLPRKILAIYDSRDAAELAYAELHRSLGA